MRTSPPLAAGEACRPSYVLTLVLLGATPSFADPAPLAGIVVDQSGRALPRAFVRILDASGAATSSTFADDAGRFQIAAVPANCRVEASMTGFSSVTAPCSSSSRLVLSVAPIAETVVVTATRTEAPADQTGASVTAFTVRRSRTASRAARRRSAAVGARHDGDSHWRRRQRHVAVRARRRKQLQQGAARRHSAERAGRHVQLQQPDDGQYRTCRDRAQARNRRCLVRTPWRASSSCSRSAPIAPTLSLTSRSPSKAARLERCAAAPQSRARRGRSTTRSAPRRFDTDNQAPNNQFRNTTLSANVGVALGSTATLRVIGRGELEHVGTPGQTAFARPDLDAFFERQDGVGGVTFDQQVSPAFRQRAAYSFAVSHQQSTDLVEDPPYTPRFGDREAPFAFSDFTFDSRTNLRRHHASYQADMRLTTDASAYGDHRLTVLADWDGERATLVDKLAGNRNACISKQLRRGDPAPGVVGAHLRHCRRPRGAQRQLRHGGGPTGFDRVHRPSGKWKSR